MQEKIGQHGSADSLVLGTKSIVCSLHHIFPKMIFSLIGKINNTMACPLTGTNILRIDKENAKD